MARRRTWGGVASTITSIRSVKEIVDYVTHLSTGLEAYLGQGRRATLVWGGAGAAACGLEGVAGDGDVTAVLSGVDPADIAGGRVVANKARKVHGFEMSFSAPKSVSAGWADADAALRGEIEAAIAEARTVAMDWLEGQIAWTRLGKPPHHGWVPGEGLLWAAALHETSRAGDPQLHTHVLIANEVRTPDGKWRTLDARFLFDRRPLAASIFGRTLRNRITARTGLRWGPPNHRGERELLGVADWVRHTWSTRAMEIDEAADVFEAVNPGHDGHGAVRRHASAVTRDAKGPIEADAVAAARWRTEAAATAAALGLAGALPSGESTTGGGAWARSAVRLVEDAAREAVAELGFRGEEAVTYTLRSLTPETAERLTAEAWARSAVDEEQRRVGEAGQRAAAAAASRVAAAMALQGLRQGHLLLGADDPTAVELRRLVGELPAVAAAGEEGRDAATAREILRLACGWALRRCANNLAGDIALLTGVRRDAALEKLLDSLIPFAADAAQRATQLGAGDADGEWFALAAAGALAEAVLGPDADPDLIDDMAIAAVDAADAINNDDVDEACDIVGAARRHSAAAAPEAPTDIAAAARAVLDDLAKRESVWDRTELISTLVEQTGDDVGVSALEDLADEILASSAAVAVTIVPEGVADGVRQQKPGRERWIADRALELELGIDKRWHKAQRPGQALHPDRDQVIEVCRRHNLDDDQTATVVSVLTSGRQASIVVGPAGAGKSTMVLALRDALATAPHPAPITCLTVTLSAALALERATRREAADTGEKIDGTGLTALTVARALVDPARDDSALRPGGVWLLDEASQIGDAHFSTLTRLAAARGAVLVPIGDPAQIGSILKGGMYENLAGDPEIGGGELTKIHRPAAAWEAAAWPRLRLGDETVLDEYVEHGRLVGVDEGRDPEEAAADGTADQRVVRRIADDAARAEADGHTAITAAPTRRQVDALNAEMRRRHHEAHSPTGEVLTVDWWDRDREAYRRRTFAVGDRLCTLRNDPTILTTDGMPLSNGGLWTVTSIDAGGAKLESLTGQGLVYLPTRYFDRRDDDGAPLVDYGWATTCHKAQGHTLGASLVWGTHALDQSLLYVPMTRGTHINTLYCAGDDEEALSVAAAALSRDFGHVAALEAERVATGVSHAEAAKALDDRWRAAVAAEAIEAAAAAEPDDDADPPWPQGLSV